MSIVGFDFGTTNSLVSIIRGDKPICFFDDRGLPIPSVVCYEASRAIVGRDAKERLGTAGLGVYGNIVRSPKSMLDKESIFVDGVDRHVIDVVADVIKVVRQEAMDSRGRKLDSLDSAVVTIPVGFEGRRRRALREAFLRAGIRIVQFVHEPLAALYGFFRSSGGLQENLRKYDRRTMLVFDWGGGTLDLTLCRIEKGMIFQIANDASDEVGGDLFDDALRNEVVRSVRAELHLPDQIQPHPDAITRLLHRCERAKIDLSDRDAVQVYVDHFFRGTDDDSLDCKVTRQMLEAITTNLVNAGVGRIRSLLDSAGISPAQVSLCLATGGMVNMPAIRSRLHELFGPQRVQMSEDGLAAISVGAAWIAHDRATLRLAKQVELATARNTYLPLLKAGTEMPTEGEIKRDKFDLYCTDPRDGFAKFQIVAPTRPGARVLPNDRRKILATMTIETDKSAKPFFERLILTAEVDDNLVLRTTARSLMQNAVDDVEVHDLEFSVLLGTAGDDGGGDGHLPNLLEQQAGKSEPGAVSIRSNLSDTLNSAQVPGELWYEWNPQDFDVRQISTPQLQRDERLYYEPCGRCGRASNDPLCRCGSRRAS